VFDLSTKIKAQQVQSMLMTGISTWVGGIGRVQREV
jgi:hypothetical protein